jgi:hypothetical protein
MLLRRQDAPSRAQYLTKQLRTTGHIAHAPDPNTGFKTTRQTNVDSIQISSPRQSNATPGRATRRRGFIRKGSRQPTCHEMRDMLRGSISDQGSTI